MTLHTQDTEIGIAKAHWCATRQLVADADAFADREEIERVSAERAERVADLAVAAAERVAEDARVSSRIAREHHAAAVVNAQLARNTRRNATEFYRDALRNTNTVEDRRNEEQAELVVHNADHTC